jgi:hypothetical protein
MVFGRRLAPEGHLGRVARPYRRFGHFDYSFALGAWPDYHFVAESFYQRSGTWVIGCHGAGAEFMCRHDEPRDISVSGNRISAISERSGLQLTIDEKVRALRLRAGPKQSDFRAIFLVVLKAKANLPVATALTPLGCDEGAIQPECRNEHQFDLGLGRADLRFLGRVEIFPLVPPPREQSPEGPRSFLSLEKLTSGRSTPPGIDLPPVYVLGATFYPHILGAGTDISS